MGIRYNVISVYPLFLYDKVKNDPNFELSLISTWERLALGMLRLIGLNTNRSAIKVV